MSRNQLICITAMAEELRVSKRQLERVLSEKKIMPTKFSGRKFFWTREQLDGIIMRRAELFPKASKK